MHSTFYLKTCFCMLKLIHAYGKYWFPPSLGLLHQRISFIPCYTLYTFKVWWFVWVWFFFCVCVLGFFYCGGFLLGFLFVGLFFFYSCLHAYHWAIWGKETPTNLLANIAMPAKNPNAVPRFKPTGIWVYSYDSFCLRKQIKVISTRLPHYCNIAVISGRPSFLLAVASASPCSIRRLRCFKPEISISFMCHAIAL